MGIEQTYLLTCRGDGTGSVRRRIDNWIADSAERLTQQWDEEVIGLIETTVECWDASEISRRLELQVGRNLQIVRMVGALVGIAIPPCSY